MEVPGFFPWTGSERRATTITLTGSAAGLTGSTELPLSIDACGRHGKRKVPVSPVLRRAMASQYGSPLRNVRSGDSRLSALTGSAQTGAACATVIGPTARIFLVPGMGLLLFCLAFFPVCQRTAGAEAGRREPAGSGGKPRVGSPTKTNLLEMEQLILRYTNKERKQHGLQPLTSSRALRLLARSQSRNMCSTGHFQHESDSFPKGWRRFGERLRVVRLRFGGENIAYRTFSGEPDRWARAIIKGWMNSPEHRRNILGPQYRFVGVGVAPCTNRIVYAGQVFSSKQGSVPLGSRDEDRFSFVVRRLVEADVLVDAAGLSGVSAVESSVVNR